jgi:hypothetical protein
MVAELEAKDLLRIRLLEAIEKTVKESDRMRRGLMQQGLSPRQAREQAWETVRVRYIFLPPET